MELEIVIWSDNDRIDEIANIIHDRGYHTAGIRKDELGAYENHCNWQWCKANMVDSICVDLNNAIGQIVPTENVDEMPMFRYVAMFIVGDDDDTEQEQEQEQEQEHDENVVMNIGMTTKNGVNIDVDSAMDTIGRETDCTITRCVGFYKGKRENSLKVEIYGIRVDIAISMAAYFCHIFRQECVAVTCKARTVFVNGDYDENEFITWCDALEK